VWNKGKRPRDQIIPKRDYLFGGETFKSQVRPGAEFSLALSFTPENQTAPLPCSPRPSFGFESLDLIAEMHLFSGYQLN